MTETMNNEKSRGRVPMRSRGPGGVASALLLESRGIQADLFEKHNRIGGRTGRLEEQGYRLTISQTNSKKSPRNQGC